MSLEPCAWLSTFYCCWLCCHTMPQLTVHVGGHCCLGGFSHCHLVDVGVGSVGGSKLQSGSMSWKKISDGERRGAGLVTGMILRWIKKSWCHVPICFMIWGDRFFGKICQCKHMSVFISLLKKSCILCIFFFTKFNFYYTLCWNEVYSIPK